VLRVDCDLRNKQIDRKHRFRSGIATLVQSG
jgi:hypothetical protein